MIDHLYGDATGLRLFERTGSIAVQSRPGFFVDLRFESGLERLVGVVRAQEVSVADEEAFFVVIGVDEPAGNPVRAVAANLSGVGMEDIDTVEF